MPTDFALNRRAFLARYAGSLGSLALAQLAAEAADPLAPKTPHHAAKAKAVICLFQHGGPSQMDLFDPKPELTKQHGQAHPDKLEVHFHTQAGKLLASPFKFQKHGQGGVELSELLPHTAGIVDDITLVRSMTTDSVDHEAALRVIHSGKISPGGRRGARGCSTASAPSARNCRPTSCFPTPAGCRWMARTTGRAAACRRCIRARRSGRRARRSPTWQRRRINPPAGRRNQLDLLSQLNASHLQAPSRQRRTRSADRPLRTGRPHADRRAGRARPFQGNGRDAETLRPRSTRNPPSTASAACWPGGSSSAACASCRSSSAASRGTRTARTPRA